MGKRLRTGKEGRSKPRKEWALHLLVRENLTKFGGHAENHTQKRVSGGRAETLGIINKRYGLKVYTTTAKTRARRKGYRKESSHAWDYLTKFRTKWEGGGFSGRIKGNEVETGYTN